MATVLSAPLQPTLLGGDDEPGFDRSYTGAHRRDLDAGAWLDVVPRWVTGPDRLFSTVLDAGDWAQHSMRMYEAIVDQPRLTTSWHVGDMPAELDLLRALGASLSARYRVALTRVSANLYRDGRDSVAWHGDRVARDLPEAVVAIVTLGHERPFRLRPRGGGPSLKLLPGRGDLVVMGGTCQRTWQHSIPKVRDAGPRISVMFRESYTEEDLRRAEAARRARGNDPRTA